MTAFFVRVEKDYQHITINTNLPVLSFKRLGAQQITYQIYLEL